VQYHDRSDDPIFPARNHSTAEPTGNPDLDDLLNYWSNGEPHSSVLGCVEYALLCQNDSLTSCYDPWVNSPSLPEPEDVSDEEYGTFFGLMHSSFWSTIKTRTSNELDATGKIIDVHTSMPLKPGHWKLEAKRIFETQMIRARWEVLELARGTRASIDGFENYFPENRKDLCQKIKFQSSGYKNLSLFGLLLAAFLPPLLAVPLQKEKPLLLWPVYLLRLTFSIQSGDLREWAFQLQQSASKAWENTSSFRKALTDISYFCWVMLVFAGEAFKFIWDNVLWPVLITLTKSLGKCVEGSLDGLRTGVRLTSARTTRSDITNLPRGA
jgi:hypothetical protein